MFNRKLKYGKVKLVSESSDTDHFPLQSPADMRLSAETTGTLNLQGTWLLQGIHGDLEVLGILEFYPQQAGRYGFRLDTIRGEKEGLSALETTTTSLGSAIARGDELMLIIEKEDTENQMNTTDRFMDKEKFLKDIKSETVDGKIHLKVFRNPNRLQLIQSVSTLIVGTSPGGVSKRSFKVAVQPSDKPDMLRVTHETIAHFTERPDETSGLYKDFRYVMNFEMPPDVQTYYQSTGPALRNAARPGPKINFSGAVYQIRNEITKVVVYSATQLQKLSAGKKLEVRSRKTGQKLATLSVDTVNYTNAVCSIISGQISQIEVADAVIGY